MDSLDSDKWDVLDYLKLLPGIIFAGLIFYLSSLENPVPSQAAETIDFFDVNTVLHIAEYAVFSFLLAFGLSSKLEYYKITIIGILYAFSDEVHQYFVPTRFFDIFDILADGIGVVIGILGYLIFLMLLKGLKQMNKNIENKKKKKEQRSDSA
ncbi:MAG: VanZ family protein [Promethearchaeia archaeon]